MFRRSCGVIRRCAWWTDWRMTTPRAAATPIAGRMWKSCWRRGSAWSARSICSTSTINARPWRELPARRSPRPIPRAFLNTADEIVIVDTPPSEASPRLSSLREKALLLSADVIDAGLQRYLHAHGIEAAWGTHEHFLVYLTPGANAARMLASARRNAARFHCDVLAVVGQAGQPFGCRTKSPRRRSRGGPGFRGARGSCWRAKIRSRPSCSMRAHTA